MLVTLNDKPRSYNCKRETIVTAVTHTSEPCRNLFAQENWFRVFWNIFSPAQPVKKLLANVDIETIAEKPRIIAVNNSQV